MVFWFDSLRRRGVSCVPGLAGLFSLFQKGSFCAFLGFLFMKSRRLNVFHAFYRTFLMMMMMMMMMMMFYHVLPTIRRIALYQASIWRLRFQFGLCPPMEQKSWDLDSFGNPASSPDDLQNVWWLILADLRFTWISWFLSLVYLVLFCQEALPQQVQLEARFQHIAEMLEADDSKPLSSVFLQDEGWHKWARFETTWMFLKIMVPPNHPF